MAEESKLVPNAEEEMKGKDRAPATVESDDEDVEEITTTSSATTGGASSSSKKKKKSKKTKLKEVLTGKSSSTTATEQDQDAKLQKALGGLGPEQIAQLMELNPALAAEMGGGAQGPAQLTDALKRLQLSDVMTGLAASGKNAKDMGAYKFWSTQPVPKFGENTTDKERIEEGPIKADQTVDQVSREPPPLVAGFEWCTVELEKPEELKEVQELLYGHYVEDDEAMFRFNYSISILQWAMMPPGWKKDWHVGVRATQSRKLVGFISAIPLQLRIHDRVIAASEVNFLCIHKKLRSKRLAPVLIKEVTRRCNLAGVWQAIYTGGIVLPTPVSTCRYYHRAVDWQKLWEVGFSPLPAGSKPQYQVRKYALPDKTAVKGLREMQEGDIDAVHSLLTRYLKRYELVADFTKEDITHWLVHAKKVDQLAEQVVWSYVVEDEHKNITDFISFYCLDSSVIGSETKHKNVRAAYLFYYATEAGLDDKDPKQKVSRDALKKRLNELMADALVLSRRYKFDVFNALSLMDNGLFLEEQKFGPGDGQLHYYLFNYRANAIAGGVDKRNRLDTEHLSGIGFTML
ncbi:hypothetical protein PG994_007126 [Apiospora phragmitis]|uniref:Glycylpeptide N-tetradecanoyltransferase n=1 Tax=Apiospora phragmitis TaxID=2905665 RepID=A0ABR1V390_9PEZI